MKAYIKAISYYLPEKVVTNEELVADFPEWNAEKVAQKVGINKRHVSAKNETAGDMAYKAATLLMVENDIHKKEIDFILLCTQSPDYFLPTTACVLQKRLGLRTDIGALDYNLGCSGCIYGMALAKGLIISGIAKNVLLITSETYNKYIHPKDKGNRSIFGDAAAATLISTDGFAEIGDFVLGTDGHGAENLIVKTGASRNPEKLQEMGEDESGYLKSSDHLYMNGTEIFNFTLEAVPPLVKQTLDKNRMEKETIDMFVFHQANKFMLNTIRKVCIIPKDKFYINLENTGNTVSSTILIALKNAMDEKVIREKQTILIAGFGVGYSWGATILKF